MKSRNILLFTLCCFFTINGFAQSGVVTGKVIDSLSGLPLEYAGASLYRSADSSLINGVVTDSAGLFGINGIGNGSYYLRIDYIGYKSRFEPVNITGNKNKSDMGALLLSPTDQFLSQVMVTGTRASMLNKIDKQVYRADQFDAARGGTAIDVLKNMPSVSVNAEGAISVRGSAGFQVLINGKPVQADASTVLSQLPANTVENIELITAPSAKYDADGKAGIINIITKKGTTDGFSMFANTQIGAPRIRTYYNKESPSRYGFDATVNYRKNKWDITAGGNYQKNDIAGRRVGDVNTTVDNRYSSFPSQGERSFKRYNYAVRTSVLYTPGAQDAISAGFYHGRKNQYRLADIFYDNTKTDVNTGEVISRTDYFNSNLVLRRGDFTLGSLDYAHTFGNSSVLSVSGLYEYARFEGFTKNNNLFYPNTSDTMQYTVNNSTSPLHGYRVKADYAVSVGRGKIETGYQFRYQKQTGDFLYREQIPGTGEFITYPEFSALIDVRNTIHSVYSQYSRSFKNLELVAGLRYEHSSRDFSDNQPAADRELDLSNLFPSANILYSFNDQLTLKAGYSRRVQRSTNNELNPYPEREHSETLEQGDPDILPEFIGLSELGMIKNFDKGSLFVTLYRQDIKNPVNRVNKVYADTILNRIYTNAGNARLWGLETGINLEPARWWQFYLGANVYDYKISGSLFENTVTVNNSDVAYSINANSNFRVTPSFNVQFNINYLSERVTAQGRDSRFFLPNLSVKKALLNDRMSVTLQWQNIALGSMATNQQRITTRGSNFYTTTNYIQEVNIIMLNLGFRLNQLSEKSKLPASEFGEREF